MKDKREKLADRLRRTAGGMEIPLAMLAGEPRLEAVGSRDIIIENHKGILEYGTEEIRINCGRLVIRIQGQGLRLYSLSLSEVSISGSIHSIEYLT